MCRQSASSRHLVVKFDDQVIADTARLVVLFEFGFAPRRYVPREDIDENADDRKLALAPGQSVVPHGIDRGLDPGEMLERSDNVARPRN